MGPGGVIATLASSLGALLVCSTVAVQAQDKPIQIGVLAFGPRFVPAWSCGQADYRPGSIAPKHDTEPFYVLGMLDQLKKLNYVEDRPETAGRPGRRFKLSFRTGTPQQVRAFAREFVANRVDFIVAVATATVRIAQEETKGHPIPILMTGVSDPLDYGFVQSLARPGGSITGVSHQVVQGSGKRVELFKELLPGLRRLLTIRRAGYVPSEKSMEEIREAADRLKIDIVDRTTTTRAEIQALMASLRHGTVDGIMVLPDSHIIANFDLLIETSLAQRIPAFGLFDYMADWGAIAANGPSAFQAGQRVAGYIDKISNGAKPGDLPVEPVDPTFTVNLKAAACHGVTVPLDVLSQADRVIR
jgi:putative ABC transport system substrate-binding protein